MVELKINDIVTARYNTGSYIGRIIDWRNEEQAIVEVLAVLKHPNQGDLHQPRKINVQLFHQRKALAHHEKALVNRHSLKAYTEIVPDYNESLKAALEKEYNKLRDDDSPWAKESVKLLQDLEKDYFKNK